MKKHSAVIVGVLVGIGAVVLAGAVFAGEEEDLAAINSTREMEAASLNNADVSIIGDIFAADVESVPPGEPALKGVEAVREWYAAMLEQFEGTLEYTSSEVKIFGDWAVEQYEASVALTPKEGGDVIAEQARGIHIYQRAEDGSWKITYDVWNYGAPAAE